MSTRRSWSSVAALIPVVSLGVFAFDGAARQATPTTRTIYVTATGDKDVPVRDLTAAEFTLKEDGKSREIISAALATTPMSIALMLDDSGLGLGAIRQGSGQLVETLQGRAEFAVMAIGASNRMLVDFTKDPQIVYDGLQKMLARNSPPAYVLDGLLELAQTLAKREAVRPVIVAITSEVEELSMTRSDAVLGAIQKSGARVYYIGLGSPVTRGTRPPLTADRPADSTESESNSRNTVLGAAPKNSGGRAEQALQSSGIPVMMKAFADELANQYAVTYASDGPGGKLSLEAKRKGVKLRAPARSGGSVR